VDADVLLHGDENGVVVSPLGEIDAFSCGLLHRALRSAAATAQSRIVVDLAGTTFIDSAGLALIAAAARTAAQRGVCVRIVNAPRIVATAMRVARLDSGIQIEVRTGRALHLVPPHP
jgi:anti-sigma B factor antagonist